MKITEKQKTIKIEDFDSVINWTYKLAQKWVQNNLVPLGITSSRKYYNYKQTNGNKLPKHFPRYPKDFFEIRGTWISWQDFLGIEKSRISSKFLNYCEAKNILKYNSLIKTSSDYYNWTKRPNNLPARPNLTYKSNWEGWNMFLNSKPEPKYKNAKINDSIARVIKHQLQLGVPGAALAKEFKISEMQVTRIKRGENWSHINI